ncbi:MAG: STAS domain-containing protein [Candidatus Sumerlaeia bacterium]
MITKHPASHTIVIHSTGILDGVQVDHYRDKLRLLIEEGYRSLIFDLEQTPFISSGGLGLLVECFNKIRRLGGMFRLVNANAKVVGLIRHAQLDKMLLEAPQQPSVDFAYDKLHGLMNEEILILTQLMRTLEQALRETDPMAIGRYILEGLANMVHAERGALFYFNAMENRLEPVHWHAGGGGVVPSSFRAQPLKLDRSEWDILQGDAVVRLNPSGQFDGRDRLFVKLGFGPLLAGPLRGQKRLYGLVAVEPSQEKMGLIELIDPLMKSFLRLCALVLDQADNRQAAAEALDPGGVDGMAREIAHLTLMGTLMPIIGHQINNKLVPLVGYAQLLADKKDLPEDTSRRLQRILESTQDVQKATTKMRLAARQPRRRETIELRKLVAAAVAVLKPRLDVDQVSIDMERLPELPPVKGDSEQLFEALLVVLDCASTAFAEEQAERWVQIAGAEKDGMVQLVIEDNGLPLDAFLGEDEMDPLSAPEMQQGLRFSYAIPQNAMNRHRGRLELQGRFDGGKRVIIELPAIDPAVEDADTE